jgi:HSP90 family molecular chaperone
LKKGQKEIFYLGGENKEMLLNSPLLERLTKRGYDVLLMTEAIDEYLVTNVQKYDNSYTFVDISKEGNLTFLLLSPFRLMLSRY